MESGGVVGHRSEQEARVVVVGAGISGLLCARQLRERGHDVTVVERSEGLGGHIRTMELDGRRVDVGAESLHLGSPAARALVEDLGLSGEIVGAGSAPSWLWTAQGRRVLPAGVGPAGPTRLRPVLRSGVLGVAALARAGLEPVIARTGTRLPDDPEVDVSVGDFVATRFGAQVREAFVDPLLGGLHSGDVSRLSLRACAPSLVSAATTGRSLVLRPGLLTQFVSTLAPARRAGASPAAPAAPSAPSAPSTPASGAEASEAPASATPAAPTVMFASFAQGLSRLVDALAQGTDIRRGRTVTSIDRVETPSGSPGASRYTVRLDDGSDLSADAVVLAVPAPAAADLVRPHTPQTADRLAGVTLASTATIVLGFRPADVAGLPALAGNGILVPSRYGSTVKAATHLSTKWPHLAPGASDAPTPATSGDDAADTPADTPGAASDAGASGSAARPTDATRSAAAHEPSYLVRVSVGRAGSTEIDRLDDEELVARVRADLRRFIGITAEPTLVHVQRWRAGLPQLVVGHLSRLGRTRAELADALPGVVLAGASYDGVGLTACITSAAKASGDVATHLDRARGT